MNTELEQLKWRARRGMLELDILFREFFLVCGNELDPHAMVVMEQLLMLDDQEIYDAFTGKDPLQDKSLAELLERIVCTVKRKA